jgi:hypothetical protein
LFSVIRGRFDVQERIYEGWMVDVGREIANQWLQCAAFVRSAEVFEGMRYPYSMLEEASFMRICMKRALEGWNSPAQFVDQVAEAFVAVYLRDSPVCVPPRRRR